MPGEVTRRRLTGLYKLLYNNNSAGGFRAKPSNKGLIYQPLPLGPPLPG
jgi:hypothetical protein